MISNVRAKDIWPLLLLLCPSKSSLKVARFNNLPSQFSEIMLKLMENFVSGGII